MKRLAIYAALLASVLPNLAIADPANTRRATVAQQHAYTLSVMCWAVASYYGKQPDIVRTTEALRKMGAAMGYDNARTAKDATTMASALGVELRNDPGSMERHRASCRQIGLVS